MNMKRVGRNDPCPCGSGKKSKHCCFQLDKAQAVTAHPDALSSGSIHAALAHHQAGRLPQAKAIYQQILQADPSHPEALHLLGVIAHQEGSYEVAVELINKAISVNSSSPMSYTNLGLALQAQDKPGEAIENYQKALSLKPDYTEAHYNLGVALQAQGKLDAAIGSYYQTLALKPDYAEAYVNLGNAFKDQGKLEAAVESYQKALSIKPNLAETHFNLGILLQTQGNLEAAVNSYQKALSLKPDYAETHGNLGLAHYAQNKLELAVNSYQKAILIKPDLAETHYNLGVALQAQGKLEAAVKSYRRALALRPGYAEAHNNLGVALKDQGNLDAGFESFHQALLVKPDLAEAYNNMGNAFKDQGKLGEAIESFNKALSLKPNFAEAYNNLLFLHGYHALLDPREYLSLARGWERACLTVQDRQAARDRVFQYKPLTGRRLRVGYISGDFRQHAVSYFVEQLFSHHDRARIELYAYSSHIHRDDITERLQTLVDHWVPLIGVPDAAARECIEADGIDVLIDLSGHTSDNRLGVFARRAAPVQAHYLGFMASTGLTEMDYWIGDEILTPPETDNHFSEHVWRLPRVWVSYEGKADAPLPDWRPDRDGVVWLGSFNQLGKLTPATLALWAKVLHALPEGHLLLKTRGLADARNRQRILDAMDSYGIAPDRIELQDSGITPGWAAHMAYYNRLDIALDPVGGMGGGTTTCDALWMGVPVITLEGDRMASRMTASMLDAIGHPEWIARSEAEYVDKVVALARDVEQRKALRHTQRERMARSTLCDAQGLARNLEQAYLDMFERWMEKQKERPSIIGEKRVVFIGDSITRGTCFSDCEIYTPFATRIANELPVAHPAYIWNVYNEGLDGSCTRDWVKWIDSKIIAHNPTDVVICLGVNDSADDLFPYHVSPVNFQENLQFIINKIRGHSRTTRVVLINIPIINLNKLTWGRTDPYRVQYRGIIQSVAEANDCKVVDVFSETKRFSDQSIFDGYYFKDDGIHLSDTSHILIYNKLLPILCMCR